jgi:hypothetical protein
MKCRRHFADEPEAKWLVAETCMCLQGDHCVFKWLCHNSCTAHSSLACIDTRELLRRSSSLLWKCILELTCPKCSYTQYLIHVTVCSRHTCSVYFIARPTQIAPTTSPHVVNSAFSSSAPTASFTSQQPRTPAPLRKRKCITRACDECKIKKIKCDGLAPCGCCVIHRNGMTEAGDALSGGLEAPISQKLPTLTPYQIIHMTSFHVEGELRNPTIILFSLILCEVM